MFRVSGAMSRLLVGKRSVDCKISNSSCLEIILQVTNAVHAKGSYIYLQLWALGRTAVPASQGIEPDYPYAFVSASDIPLDNSPYKPRPLTVSEIQTYIQWYVTAAKNAVERAGFDGVEVHGANSLQYPENIFADVLYRCEWLSP